MDYLKGIGYIHDFELADFAEENGKTEDQVIEDMVYADWSIGRDTYGWNEFWE